MSHSALRKTVAAVFLAIVCAAIASRGLTRGLNHDEQQFIAPALLFADYGLVPYRDYPVFHLPNLIYLYGFASEFFGCKLLAARLLCIAASTLTALLVFFATDQLFRSVAGWRRLLLCVSFTLLLVSAPLFTATTGLVWNHDIPTLLALLAALATMHAASCRLAVPWLILAGVLVGFAVGCRISYAPLLAPFGLASILLPGQTWKARITSGALFSSGAIVALSPSLYSLIAHTDAFLFGNFEFPRLALLDPENERIRKTFTWWRKLRYFAKEIVRSDWAAFLAFAAVGVPALVVTIRRRDWNFPSLFALALFPFLLMGTFAPSRYQFQHFYVLLPFVILATAIWLARRVEKGDPSRRASIFLGAIAVLATASALSEYRNLVEIFSTSKWLPTEAHATGEEIRKHVGDGKVLTLAPLYPLEGGLEIYPALATGPFGWRNAHILEPSRRPALGMLAPDDLEAFLANDPPAGILLGYEKEKLEDPMREYARRHGYRAVDLDDDHELWVW